LLDREWDAIASFADDDGSVDEAMGAIADSLTEDN
jgi:hypothetical protein